jgi:hypothetical protein
MRYYPTFAQSPNEAQLTIELNTAFSITNAGCGYDGRQFVDVPDNITLQQVQTVVDAHNPATLTADQQKAVARALMLSDAKNYLSNQLATANPNVQTIFNTVKAYVDGNAILTQMVTNQIALFNTAYGVTVNPAGATAADRTRYLVCCQLVLATIA